MAHVEVFEAFFQKADVDNDGRISGVEAVCFFRGAGLPQATLAKIWQFSDQAQTGFLTRQEFYNALKLVTVAQTGRELTPELVKAALFGAAAPQIPPPRMILYPPSSRLEETSAPGTSQSTSFAGKFNQQFSAQSGGAQELHPQAVYPEQKDTSQGGNKAMMHRLQYRVPFVEAIRQDLKRQSLTTTSLPLGAQLPTSNGLFVESGPQQFFASSTPMLDIRGISAAASSYPTSSFASKLQAGFRSCESFNAAIQTIRPVGAGPPKSKSNPEQQSLEESLRIDPRLPMPVFPTARPFSASSTESSEFPISPSSLSITSDSVCANDGQPVSALAFTPWPRMAPNDVQRFLHVFKQVDTDQDGKITGEQARDLFLSWQLPREVLREVWNLSDQDNDSMLSASEFCTALYLLEKFREGRPVPTRLPTNIHMAQGLEGQSLSPQCRERGCTWQQPQGNLSPQDSGLCTASRPDPACLPLIATPAGEVQLHSLLPPQGEEIVVSGRMSHASEAYLKNPNHTNQNTHSTEDSKPALTEPSKLVEQVTELIRMMSQLEKAEYYRSKLHELILFKGRCDNKLAEKAEKAAALKLEVNSLAHHYEEKYNVIAELEGQIAAEVATLQRTREKTELNLALAEGNSDGALNVTLQTQVDCITTDLDKLRKTLLDRAMFLGVEIRQEDPKEMPFGWKPNIQEKAAEWNKDWDNLADEGFIEVQEYISTTAGEPVSASSITEPSSAVSSNHEGVNAPNFSPSAIETRAPPEEYSSALGSVNAATVSKSTGEASTGKGVESFLKGVSKPTCEAVTGSAVQTPKSEASKSFVEGLTSSLVDIPARNLLESSNGQNAPAIDFKSSNYQPKAESTQTTTKTAIKASERYVNMEESAELKSDIRCGATSTSSSSSSKVESSIVSHAFGGKGNSWRYGANDDNPSPASQVSWELKCNSPGTQTSIDVTASSGAIQFDESTGSFEPRDYFDLFGACNLSTWPQTASSIDVKASTTVASEQTRCSHSVSYDNSQPSDFLITPKDCNLTPTSSLIPVPKTRAATNPSMPNDNPGAHLRADYGSTCTSLRFDSFDDIASPVTSPRASAANDNKSSNNIQDGLRAREIGNYSDGDSDPFADTGPFAATTPHGADGWSEF